MNTSEKISRVIGELQVHERLHWLIRQLLMQHTNAGFMVVRAGMTAAAKWAALEMQRRDLLAVLCDVADREQVSIPDFCRVEPAGVDHASD